MEAISNVSSRSLKICSKLQCASAYDLLLRANPFSTHQSAHLHFLISKRLLLDERLRGVCVQAGCAVCHN